MTGEGLLLVDFRGNDAALGAESREHAARRLRELPCPSIARVEPGPAEPDPLAARFDLCIESDDALAPVLETLRSRPIASLALVQLLRHGVTLDLHEALIAESLVYSTLQAGPEFASWLRERPPGRRRSESLAPAVQTERRATELVITLNRPEKHNAFSAEMRDGLTAALHVALADDSIESITLRGAGRSFCSGGDLDEFGSFPDPATAHVIRATRNPGRLLCACADRVQVFVHGACVGAGIELPGFAARVVADPGAFFLLPEVSMGLVPGAGGTASLPGRIGRQRTAWLALAAERIDARTALDWGLIDEIRAAADPAHPVDERRTTD